MTFMTANERNFLKNGGGIWCMRCVDDSRWEIFKMLEQSEELFSINPDTEESAIRWIFVLMDLSNPDERLAVHHAVPRSDADRDPRYAPL